jgi:hypothetical protein
VFLTVCGAGLLRSSCALTQIHGIYIEDLQIARSDPRGDYSVQLSLDGNAWKRFKFQIE